MFCNMYVWTIIYYIESYTLYRAGADTLTELGGGGSAGEGVGGERERGESGRGERGGGGGGTHQNNEKWDPKRCHLIKGRITGLVSSHHRCPIITGAPPPPPITGCPLIKGRITGVHSSQVSAHHRVKTPI